MDLGSLGINSGIVISIVFFTELIKKLDKKEKYKKLYIIIPLFFGIIASFLITSPLNVLGIITNAIIYAGVSGYIYKSGKLAINKET
jgi:Ca2+/Na+ antiporter